MPPLAASPAEGCLSSRRSRTRPTIECPVQCARTGALRAGRQERFQCSRRGPGQSALQPSGTRSRAVINMEGRAPGRFVLSSRLLCRAARRSARNCRLLGKFKALKTQCAVHLCCKGREVVHTQRAGAARRRAAGRTGEKGPLHKPDAFPAIPSMLDVSKAGQSAARLVHFTPLHLRWGAQVRGGSRLRCPSRLMHNLTCLATAAQLLHATLPLQRQRRLAEACWERLFCCRWQRPCLPSLQSSRRQSSGTPSASLAPPRPTHRCRIALPAFPLPVLHA